MHDESWAGKIAAVQSRHDDHLLGFPNVVGTGIGYRQVAGAPSGELCLVVMVSKKIPESVLPAQAVLPRELDGVTIDVIETGAFSV